MNTNIRHRGVLFHVQSEASDIQNPHILTHLFDGGNILASMKGDYGDKLGSENLDVEVRAMMENQHKDMLRALTRGEHDEAIISRMGVDVFYGENGQDTDVTIPPSEVAQAIPVTVESPEDVPTVMAMPEGTESVSAKEQPSRAFGDSVVSQKSLDEVVLEFLVDNARKHKRPSK